MEPCSLIAAFLVPHLRGSIPQTLQEIEALCVPMNENRMVCSRVHVRLLEIWQNELQFVPTARLLRQRVAPALGRYGELLVRFADLLKTFAIDDCLFRLILNRQLFVKLDQLHRDIDAVVLALVEWGGGHEQEASVAAERTRVENQERLVLGRVQWEADRIVQLHLDKHRSGYTAVIQSELNAIKHGELGEILADARDALAAELNRNDVVEATGDCKPTLLLFVTFTHDGIGKELVEISSWRFVRRDSVGKIMVCRGESSSQSRYPPAHREDGNGVAEQSSDSELLQALSGCKLVRSHSACHLCTRVVFAFKKMATSAFSELHEKHKHKQQLISLFYSVELSLHCPHENELFSSDGEGDQSLGVCEFGFANLRLGHNDKRDNEDAVTTLC